MIILTLTGGCAAPVSRGADELAPDVDRTKALARLDEIEPRPVFPEGAQAQPAEVNPQAQRHLQTGRGRFDEGLWADAALAFEKALAVDANCTEARIMLARTALQHGDFSAAKSQLDKVLAVHPRSVSAHQLLGEIAYQQCDLAAAIVEFRLALAACEGQTRRPECVLASLSLALALADVGYLTAAAEQFEAYIAAAASPTPEMNGYRELREMMALYRGKASAMLGDIQSRLGRHDKAVEAYQRAVAELPDESQYDERLILALARGGRSAEALQRARMRAVHISDDEKAIEFLAGVCAAVGERDALDAELAVIAAQTDRRSLRITIARRLMKHDRRHDGVSRIDKAGRIADSLLEADPDDVEALLLRAEIELRNGRCEAAVETLVQVLHAEATAYQEVTAFFTSRAVPESCDVAETARQAAARRPNDSTLCFLLALISMRDVPAGKEAEAHCRRALELDDDFAPASVLLAVIAHGAKDWEEVIRGADAAIEKGLKDSMIYRLKGEAHDALDEHDQAEAALLESFRLDRKDASPLFVLAQSAERRGQEGRCEKLYRRILDDVDPKFTAARERLVRLLLNSRNADRAGEYLADFERLGLKGAAHERCRALMDLATSRQSSGAEKLESYRERLREIVRKFPGNAETHVALAMSYEATGDVKKALAEAEAALRIAPDDVSALERAADYRAKQLDFEGAASAVERLIRSRPRDLGYLQRLVQLSLAQADFDSAARTLRRILDREDPAETRAAFVAQLVAVLRFDGKNDESVETARKWLEEKEDEPQRRSLYLSALQSAERYEEAVKTARQWLEADPDDRELRRELIEQLVAAKRLTEAQQWVVSWLEDDPDDQWLNLLLVRLFWEARDWESAIETLQTAREEGRNREQYERNLGLSYRFARRYDDAVELYRRLGAGVLRPIDPLVDTLIDAGRFREAEKELSAVLNPTGPVGKTGDQLDVSSVMESRRILARVYLLTRREQQAFQQYEEILSLLEKISEMSPGSMRLKEDLVGINNDLGYTYADHGYHLDKAERMIRFALGEQPINAAFIDSLAWVYYKRGDFGEAIKLLERAMRLSSRQDAVMYDHLADTLYRAGRATEAKVHWEKALELSADDKFPPPLAEDRRTHKSVQRKLDQLTEGKEVKTAAVVGAADSR